MGLLHLLLLGLLGPHLLVQLVVLADSGVVPASNANSDDGAEANENEEAN